MRVYMGGKEARMFRDSDDTGVGIASEPPQLIMPLTDSLHVDEKSAVALSDRESRLPSRSSSTISRFVDRLGTSVYSLSSLRPIPSWRNTFPRAHRRYAEIERGHDVGGGSASNSPSLPLPRLRGGAPPPSQHSSSGNLRNPSLRHRRRHAVKRTRNQNNVFFRTPLSDLLTGFSHAMTISTGGHRDSGTSNSTSTGNSSLGTHHYSSSFDSSGSNGHSHIPFPSMSDADESNRTFPSPYSADAAAAFQNNKSDAPHFFDRHVKFGGIFEDHMQVVFGEAANDRTSTTSASNTSSCATSARTAFKPPGLLVRSRRRVSALARAVKPVRRKFLSIFDKKLPPRPADDDDDPVEYDIPCLAYVTCLW